MHCSLWTLSAVLLLQGLDPGPAFAQQPVGPVSASKVYPLSPEKERALQPNDRFKECDVCPEMVVVPAGSFIMGSPASEPGRSDDEGPQHEVTLARPFAVGKFSVTFEEWRFCLADGGCGGFNPSDRGWGRGRRPVIMVTWEQAKTYVEWLARKTGKPYRLLTEAEREYVTRAGTTTPYWWGTTISTKQANYNGTAAYASFTVNAKAPKSEYRRQTLPVDSFEPNPFGLYQVHGNVFEFVEDCYNKSHAGAPTDGSARTSGDCAMRVRRGGSWYSYAALLRSANRFGWDAALNRDSDVGFRLARTLQP